MTRKHRRLPELLVLAMLVPGLAAAATVVLAPGGSLQHALREAGDGDILEIRAGEYRGEVAIIEQRRLTIRGVGGRPVLHADGRSAEGKAILVVRDGDIRIENLEFRGARVPDRNGAGIRFERGRLVVERCVFLDNENGILTAGFANAELVVQDSEFGMAPSGPAKLPHLLYVGSIGQFTLSGSRFSGGRRAHLVKSRARRNIVRYNELVDGPAGEAAYELEFPNGGLAWVVGNVIAQGPDTTNLAIVSFGVEGRSDDRPQGLFMAHNTLINFAAMPGWFVRVGRSVDGAQRRFVNNLFLGLGVVDVPWMDLFAGNVVGPVAWLRDVAAGDFRLRPDAWPRGKAAPAGVEGGIPLQPAAEFTRPTGTRPLAPPGRWSPGAYQE